MAKFCPNCGSEMIDEAAMCVKCGTMVGENNTNKNNEEKPTASGEKKKGLPAWAIVLIVLGGLGLLVVIAIIVFAVIGINALKKVDPNEIKDKLNDYIEENTDSTLYGTIGDTLTVKALSSLLALIEKYANDAPIIATIKVSTPITPKNIPLLSSFSIYLSPLFYHKLIIADFYKKNNSFELKKKK